MNKKNIRSKTIIQKENIKPDIKTHYTSKELVNYCISKMPFEESDSVLDVGAGINKVWFDNLPIKNKDWVEIELAKDFFTYNKKTDWLIGNPPYRGLWDVIKQSAELSIKGFAYLISIDGINRLTPLRLQYLKEKGFTLSKIHVVCCKRWFGRYFFVIFTKEENAFYEWSLKNYD